MTKLRQSFTREYGIYDKLVLSSRSWVAEAGKSGDAVLIAKAQARHAAVMATVNRILGR